MLETGKIAGIWVAAGGKWVQLVECDLSQHGAPTAADLPRDDAESQR